MFTMTDDEAATRRSMVFHGGLVLVPGLAFVFGLIYLVFPHRAPPALSWANGTYVNACCQPIVLKDGVFTAGGRSARYTVVEDKFGNQLDVPSGVSVSKGRVEFGGSLVFVHFNDDSVASPALGVAKSLHLSDEDNPTDYVFTKRD